MDRAANAKRAANMRADGVGWEAIARSLGMSESGVKTMCLNSLDYCHTLVQRIEASHRAKEASEAEFRAIKAAPFREKPISWLCCDERAMRVLESIPDIQTIGDLLSLPLDRLLDEPNFGRRSLESVQQAVDGEHVSARRWLLQRREKLRRRVGMIGTT